MGLKGLGCAKDNSLTPKKNAFHLVPHPTYYVNYYPHRWVDPFIVPPVSRDITDLVDSESNGDIRVYIYIHVFMGYIQW